MTRKNVEAEILPYKCVLCGKNTRKIEYLGRHLATKGDSEHSKWRKAHGVREGDVKAAMEVIKAEEDKWRAF